MSLIDKKELFRSLVVNESLPGFDYMAHKFSFKTVFHRSAYYYCCCRCAFEHEYLLHISNMGEINEDIYERTVQNIINGECPHVKNASPTFVTETSVHAIHVAAARGNKDAVKWHLENGDFDGLDAYWNNADNLATVSNTGVFQLLPYDITALKDRSYLTKVYSKKLAIHLGPPIPFISRWHKDSDTIIVDILPRQGILQYHSGLRVIGNTRFLAPGSRFPTRPEFIIRGPSGTPVLRHRPQTGPLPRADMLNPARLQAMHMLRPRPPLSGPRFQLTSNLPFRMQPSGIEERNDGDQNDLSDDEQSKHDTISFEEQIMDLTDQLLYKYNDSKTEIIEALRNIPKTQRETSKNLNYYLTLPHIQNDFIKTLIDLGASVNYIHTFGKTAIDTLLKVRPANDVIMVRERVALLINENPGLELHKESVGRALKRDANFQGRTEIKPFKSYELNCTYKADAQQHGIFGYDGQRDFALNFMGPFLMECGFQVDRREIEHFLSKEQVPPFCLHEAEIEYLLAFLENPRSLLAICRDTLRKHFRGRAIHSYVERVDCPVKIKDIILMKSLLNSAGNGNASE